MSLIGTLIIIYILLVDSSTSRSGAGQCEEGGLCLWIDMVPTLTDTYNCPR